MLGARLISPALMFNFSARALNMLDNIDLARLTDAKIASSRGHQRTTRPSAQRGVSLVELMVGITIGLFVLAVALGSLMISRGISGTVSDASGIQQQAGYAMRTVGMQLRQAGSLFLNLNSSNAVTENELMAPVAFEEEVNTFNPANAVRGADVATGNTLTVGYRDYAYPTYNAAAAQFRNCLGQNGTGSLVQSSFVHDAAAFVLRCGPTDAAATLQPIIRNVANFQLRYLLQSNAVPGAPTIAYTTAAAVDTAGGNAWSQVQGVEVCMVLFGDEAIGMSAPTSATDLNGTYLDCDGTTRVDMTALTGARASRMHLVFRSVYQIRSQGLVGTVL